MPICSICDDTGLLNSDSTDPKFCYCSAGKQARRQWEVSKSGGNQTRNAPPSFIDISQLEQVNASVDAMRASLFGSATPETALSGKHPAVQLLYRVAHPGHEISIGEAAQLHDLAKALEDFLGNMAFIGRKK
jgi:hypothetical protein